MRSIPGIHHNRSLGVLHRTYEFGLRVVLGIAMAASAAPVYAAGRGDSDEDGDIDLRDFANLQMCIPEPGDPPPFGDCLIFDFNGDEVVDQADFEAMYDTLLGPGVFPPRITDTAVVLGRVFIALPDGEDDVPLEGARITAAPYCDECEEEEDLPPVAFTDAQGNFRYETVPFEGQTDFLLRIRKDGYAENLRRITIIAARCQRTHDAFLNEVNPPVMVKADEGATLEDQNGEVTLIIPPGALMRDSEIGVTSLITHRAIRDRLPQLVGSPGRFVDIAGVFGERTNKPVTMQVPNRYNLPIGTEVRFGKVDHNSLEWMDLAEEGGDIGVGVVKPDPETAHTRDRFPTVPRIGSVPTAGSNGSSIVSDIKRITNTKAAS